VILRDTLAEKLLAKVLGWQPLDIARERPVLQAMASLKYDEYDQFSPGLRFIESLALWLDQFETSDRQTAYQFIKSSLVFCSSQEMDHLVEIAYQDHVRPILLARSAGEQGLNPHHNGRIASSIPFRILQRQTLFLGLSDGARIDTFRRANGPDLNHEQIWQTHELPRERGAELLSKLSLHLAEIDADVAIKAPKFRTIVLLDDFSASGSSYYSIKDSGSPSGKIATFLSTLTSNNTALHELCDPNGVEIIVLIYMATEQAMDHLREALTNPTQGVARCYVRTVQLIPAKIKLSRGGPEEFTQLIEKYYDPAIFDVHMQKGKTKDGKYGYADCGLPVVLQHNTPNNSVAILWFYEHCNVRGIFPRVQRHRVMS
jgi:hypothetical protein